MCVFSEELQSQQNNYSTCIIEYSREGSTDRFRLANRSQGVSVTGTTETVEIHVSLTGLNQSGTTYHFIVTATSGNTTIGIEGNFAFSGKLMSIIIIVIEQLN